MEWLQTIGDWAEWWNAPPPVAKKDGALRFGILGAAMIGPQALIYPAKSHPEAIIAAVAARDAKKAQAYAKKYGIPIVHKSYDDLINDPAIDCIYNPLPNGLHYEWTIKALKAGKHVLLEKPTVSNAEEARSLFQHPLLQQANAPVLLEARHYQFHPAWHAFLSKFDPKEVKHAQSYASMPKGFIGSDNIRFNYSLAGGTLMDLGPYILGSLRGIYRAEPTAVTSAVVRKTDLDERCDEAIRAIFSFPNGGTAELSGDLRARVVYDKATGKTGVWKWLLQGWPDFTAGQPPALIVTLRPTSTTSADGKTITTEKTVILKNFMAPHLGHNLEVHTATTTIDSNTGAQRSQDKKVDAEKHYNWWEGYGGETSTKEQWATYRFQLEAFVDKIKGRKGSGKWIDAEESVKHMEATDMVYEMAGLGLRPTSGILE